MLAVHHGVEFAQEIDGFQILAATVFVGDPVLARVIEVQHRGDRVHPQTVQVALLDPVQGAGQQEILHFVTAEVEDQGGPVEMFAQAGIGVFVQRFAVEAGQAVSVLGKVRRHPVEDHADIVLVAVVDEIAEVVRRAEAAGRGVVAGGLITPGGIVGVFGDR